MGFGVTRFGELLLSFSIFESELWLQPDWFLAVGMTPHDRRRFKGQGCRFMT